MKGRTMEKEIIRERWKKMTFLQKVEYLWMYYKIWLVIAVSFVGIIWMWTLLYRGTHTTVLLNVAVVDGDSQKTEDLMKQFMEYEGISEHDGIVRVKANIPNEDGTTSMKTILTTLFGAEAVDVLICTEEVYEEYKDQGGFLSMSEVLCEENDSYNENVLKDGIIFSADSVLGYEGVVSYDKIYVVVPVNGKNQKMASQFIRFLLK